MLIYVVKPGDSLYAIARSFRIPVERLALQNGIADPSRLTPGQSLVVRFPSRVYTVQPGDTLGDIAARLGTTVNALWQNNPQLGGNDRIYPGQSLVVSDRQPKLGRLKVNGYAYPSIDQALLRQTLPYLTYLSVFSWGFTPDGRLLSVDDGTLLEAAREFGVKPLMVLTTIDEDGRFSSERADRLLNDAGARRSLVENLRQVLLARGYGGVDVDFEYIPPQDEEVYTDFIRQLECALSPDGLEVFVSLAPKTSAEQKGLLYEAHNYAELGRAADRALLMTYEWGYARSEPMAVAPLDKVERVVRFAASQIDPGRILMGMPNYGYVWTLPHRPGESVARSIGNVEAVERAVQVGACIRFDEAAQSPYMTYWQQNTEYESWFEDARSVNAKLRLVHRCRLGGISVWNLMRWFPQLWMVLSGLFEIEKL